MSCPLIGIGGLIPSMNGKFATHRLQVRSLLLVALAIASRSTGCNTPPTTARRLIRALLELEEGDAWLVVNDIEHANRSARARRPHCRPRRQTYEGQQVVRAVVRDIEEGFHITHTTVQVEVEGCEPNDLYCGFRGARARARS